jgi:hypothetical protein
MKSRLIWGAIVVGAFVAFYWATIRPMMEPAPRPQPSGDRVPLVTHRPTFPLPKEFDTATIPAPRMPVPPIVSIRVDPPALKPPEIPIQNGATLDFSIGAPVVRSGGADDAALNKALKEMEEATKNIEFPATKPYLDPGTPVPKQ